IVFIHGLGGDRNRTWTWEGDDRRHFWPKELLPQACPTARILSFGYNAEFAHFFPFYGPKAVDHRQLFNYTIPEPDRPARENRDYKEHMSRPLIFVCHSLGGLVCANALSRHHGTDLAGVGIMEKTIRIVFLGTPFKGSLKAKWAGRALKVLDWASTTHKEDIKDLEERLVKLININNAFQKFLKARDRSETRQFVEIVCFFEQYAMYKGGKNIGVIVPKESACLPGVDPQLIQANHQTC
ncbi:hypothetical protein BU23DRAFT_494935, partial [Bimuria novae-zelandiae CBS 107.79]